MNQRTFYQERLVLVQIFINVVALQYDLTIYTVFLIFFSLNLMVVVAYFLILFRRFCCQRIIPVTK